MTYGVRDRRWPTIVLAVALMAGFLVAGIGAAGDVRIPEPGGGSVISSTVVAPAVASTPNWIVDPPLPSDWLSCEINPYFLNQIFGIGCNDVYSAAWIAWEGQTEQATMQNMVTMMGNSFNQTAAEVSNLNATAQELLSYYEGRAEALVPYFLNVSWNQSTADQIAIDSGLVPSIEGLALAYAYQQFQDWNATVGSWNNLFGTSGTYAHVGTPSGTGINENYTYLHLHPGTGTPLMQDGVSYNVSTPWEVWNGTSGSFFFNLGPQGSIICTNLTGSITAGFGYTSCPSYKVFDYTRGTSFSVPAIPFSNFVQHHAIPTVGQSNSVGQFDLLKLVCESSCGSAVGNVEVLDGYAFVNRSSVNPDYLTKLGSNGYPFPQDNEMVYRMWLASLYGSSSFYQQEVPSIDWTLCGMVNSNFVGAACGTGSIYEEGLPKALGSGPAAVPSTNDSLTRYASTFQALLNNTLNDTQVYFDTLHAITNGGQYSIPADCAIPPPSNGFPTSVNPADFSMSLDNGLAAYWSYLNAVGKAYDNTTTYGLEFCGQPHLALAFNWTTSWKLRLTVTASVYLTNLQGLPVYPNGTRDTASVYSNPSTWPVKNIDPTLIFPYEYQTNIPVGQVFPLPANNPVAAITVNWTGNPYYGYNTTTLPDGIPTFLQLYGEGNFVYPNGTSSSTSGGTPSQGSALYLSTCVLNGVAQSTCDLSVTYFDAFTYGHENSLVGPPPPPNSGGAGGGAGTLGGLGSGCGFQNLNQWYDGWAGYLGSDIAGAFSYIAHAGSIIPGWASFWNGLGCFLAWVVLIVVFCILAYIGIWLLGRVYNAWRN